MTAIRNLSTAFALAAAVLGLAGTAHAQAESPQIEVRYGDLDLATAAGRAKFQQRVAWYSDRACRDALGGTVNVQNKTTFDLCRKDLMQRSDSQLAALMTGQKLAAR
ncbi:UrcA family protein [Novosphingobium umbonatum]|nr:UrcA family protein [Novosphingobium umbonatum]